MLICIQRGKMVGRHFHGWRVIERSFGDYITWLRNP
jgi:hypothetical protein